VRVIGTDDGVILRLRTGCQRNQLPEQFGDDSSVHRGDGTAPFDDSILVWRRHRPDDQLDLESKSVPDEAIRTKATTPRLYDRAHRASIEQ
jgi:hypothetical protein